MGVNRIKTHGEKLSEARIVLKIFTTQLKEPPPKTKMCAKVKVLFNDIKSKRKNSKHTLLKCISPDSRGNSTHQCCLSGFLQG